MSAPRKGSSRIADIPPSVLREINAGKIECLTLVEALAVDFHQLLKNSFPDIDKIYLKEMKNAKTTGWVQRTRLAGKLLYQNYGTDKKVFAKILSHPSDQVRGWGAALIAEAPHIDLAQRLAMIKSLADDANMGTREVAWLMLRPVIAVDIKHSIEILKPWARDSTANIRRFASEATRPRGVWCAHIHALRQNPEQGLALLDPLHADPSRYVQNSVANWLNDASKDQPDFVSALCKKWARQSPAPETAYICKRALRTVNK